MGEYLLTVVLDSDRAVSRSTLAGPVESVHAPRIEFHSDI